MYKIATLNKLSPKGLALLGKGYQLTDDAAKADAILVRSQDMHHMKLSKNLLAIARAGAGTNNIPIDACSEAGTVVFNTPGANANAVKELVLTAMLMTARNVNEAISWCSSITDNAEETVEKNKSLYAGEEIRGKTLAVVGLGYIGVLVANASKDLGMNVVAYDPYISVQNAHDLSPSVRLYDNLTSMLSHADFVSIHVPANAETKGMFDAGVLEAMKRSAVLLNFSRDSLVVSEDVKRALGKKKIRKYVTDFPTDELLGVENAILIPHLGASTKESEENCAVMAVKELMNYIDHGIIENSVNFPMANPGPKETAARICILNKNIPSMLGQLTSALAKMDVNIGKLINKSRGDLAYTIIDVDSKPDMKKLTEAFSFDGIISVRVI